MIRSVIKHSYLKGKNGRATSRAHINYIAYRGGEEAIPGGRKFFDRDNEEINVKDVRQMLYDMPYDTSVVMHKLIVSPGMQEVDLQEYTRELMDKLSHEKGLELNWKAVIHDNTDHQHAHVVIMGLDKEGHRVKIKKTDHAFLRKCGDEYLDREHKLERYLDREVDRLLEREDYNRGGDDLFKEIIYGKDRNIDERKEKDRTKDDPERDRREYEKFDQDMRKSITESNSAAFKTGQKQKIREQQGKLSDTHGNYELAKSWERIEDYEDENLKYIAKQELEYMKQLAREDSAGKRHDPVLDRLLGDDTGYKREYGNENNKGAWKTFESDRQVKSQEQEQEKERDDRNRDGSGE